MRHLFSYRSVTGLSAVAVAALAYLTPTPASAFTGGMIVTGYTPPTVGVQNGVLHIGSRVISNGTITGAGSAAVGARAIAVRVTQAIVRGQAARAVAAACFSNPVLCAGAAALTAGAAIYWSEDLQKWITPQEQTKEGLQVCVTIPSGQTCAASIDDAAAVWRGARTLATNQSWGPFTMSSADRQSCTNVTGNGQTGVTGEQTRIASSVFGPSNEYFVVGMTCKINTWVEVAPAPVESEEDFKTAVEESPMTADEAAEVLKNAGLPVPVKEPIPIPEFKPEGQPYPRDGKMVQPGYDVAPCPGDADDGVGCVSVEPTTKEIETADDPNTPEDETVYVDPSPTTDPDAPPEQSPLCELFPNILACQPVGEIPDAEIPKRSVSVAFAAETPGLPSGCPPPVLFYGQQTFSYDPICSKAPILRPLIVGFAALSSLLLCVAALRSSS